MSQNPKLPKLFCELDPAIDKRLRETVKREKSSRRDVVESALNIYFAVKSAADNTQPATEAQAA